MLSNENLVSNLKNLVGEERRILGQILEALREVERRKLFLEIGYSSLFDFCTRELQYSEGAAPRRIAAMRLVRDIPQVEDKSLSGSLSLSVISQAQSFFGKQKQKSKPLSLGQKMDLLNDLENSSTRECERKLLKLDPELQRKDQDRPISESLTEIRFTADQEFMQKLEQIKNLFSNARPNASTKEILEFCMNKLLSKRLPPPAAVTAEKKAAPKYRRIHISRKVQRLVWHKSESRCCFVGTKGRCTAKKFLHVDHIRPISRGGGHEPKNLQLLCAAHNLAKADRPK